MSKTPGPISYPNLIQDHHTVVKMREIIDSHNALKLAADQTAAAAQKNADAIAAMPTSFVTPNDVNSSINTWALTSLTKPPKGSPSFIQVLNAGLVQLGIGVPHPPAGADAPVTLAAEKLQVLSALHWGKRSEAPLLAREEAGFTYYILDYAHMALWDGWSWILLDGGGGYFVDTTVELGVGYQLCDGTHTDYIINDTVDLELAPFITPRYRPLRRGHKRYFRR